MLFFKGPLHFSSPHLQLGKKGLRAQMYMEWKIFFFVLLFWSGQHKFLFRPHGTRCPDTMLRIIKRINVCLYAFYMYLYIHTYICTFPCLLVYISSRQTVVAIKRVCRHKSFEPSRSQREFQMKGIVAWVKLGKF